MSDKPRDYDLPPQKLNPIQLILHIGAALATEKDLSQEYQDLVAGKNIGADTKQVVVDILTLFDDGVLDIPNGMTKAEVETALNSLANS